MWFSDSGSVDLSNTIVTPAQVSTPQNFQNASFHTPLYTFDVHDSTDGSVDHTLQISMSSSRPSDSAATLDAADDDRNRNPASLALFRTEASCWDFLQ